MAVSLRKKPLSNGKYSLFIDYYADGVRQKEYLKMYLFKKPKDELEKQHNKEILSLAQSIRNKREEMLKAGEFDLQSSVHKSVNIFLYFDKYVSGYGKKDKELVRLALQHFKTYLKASHKIESFLRPNQLTETVCMGYRDYLKATFNGETGHSYFSRFKKVLRQAVRDKIFTVSPADEVANEKGESQEKDVLSTDEIKRLAATPCGNDTVKRAFLFSCFTGLRLIDVRGITWKEIQESDGKLTLRRMQTKTEKQVSVSLNASAVKLIGERKEPGDKVFDLMGDTGIRKNLKAWAKKAGLQKHITFHVARHSFATNLLIYETDILTVSRLLGHTTTKMTQKYIRIAETLKEQAVNRLPEIDL